ncbi:hypothetical protein EGR_09565 [Echinococcus granulosus]|uniref:Uncharacterized protein n=1 Tax=Echinococcus granulosus TaxID=6210 RepID=W6U4U9_ECHGR|nr:hypothetical protein EGR_09565 [Echinococcus granulosus]EUB55586.1 hypothetical protein EGR_09565 [Echinococcus granulosus]
MESHKSLPIRENRVGLWSTRLGGEFREHRCGFYRHRRLIGPSRSKDVGDFTGLSDGLNEVFCGAQNAVMGGEMGGDQPANQTPTLFHQSKWGNSTCFYFSMCFGHFQTVFVYSPIRAIDAGHTSKEVGQKLIEGFSREGTIDGRTVIAVLLTSRVTEGQATFGFVDSAAGKVRAPHPVVIHPGHQGI